MLAVALLFLAAGCVTGPPVHTVEQGETVYSIAWQYGLNWHRLARWNNIQPPYRIYPGQRLILAPPDRIRTVQAAQSGPASQPRAAVESPVARAENGRTSEPAQQTGQTGKRAPGPRGRQSGQWLWPVAAKYIDGDGVTRSRKGIDILGEYGAPIRAARAGRVVYSGSGLEGYGNLLIIKHDDNYLSAYGFNSRLLVTEGARVSAGEKIAEMGMGPGQTPMLHFEIRHDGQPLKVLEILPPLP